MIKDTGVAGGGIHRDGAAARGGDHQGARAFVGGEAANAVVDTVRSLTTPTPEGDWYSVAVHSAGDYGWSRV